MIAIRQYVVVQCQHVVESLLARAWRDSKLDPILLNESHGRAASRKSRRCTLLHCDRQDRSGGGSGAFVGCCRLRATHVRANRCSWRSSFGCTIPGVILFVLLQFISSHLVVLLFATSTQSSPSFMKQPTNPSLVSLRVIFFDLRTLHGYIYARSFTRPRYGTFIRKPGTGTVHLRNCMEKTLFKCEICQCGFNVTRRVGDLWRDFKHSSTASGSSTTVQACQTRPRSQFGQNCLSG